MLYGGKYEMGRRCEMAADAVEEGLHRNSRKLEMVDFQNAFAAKNFLPDEQNPFISPAWHTIDTSRLQPKDEEEIDDTTTPLGQKRKNGKKRKKSRGRSAIPCCSGSAQR